MHTEVCCWTSCQAGGADTYPLNYAPEFRWVLQPNGNGEYWLVTGTGSDGPGKMLYLDWDGTFAVWDWQQDPKCMSAFLEELLIEFISC